jgi:hypothetical protein
VRNRASTICAAESVKDLLFPMYRVTGASKGARGALGDVVLVLRKEVLEKEQIDTLEIVWQLLLEREHRHTDPIAAIPLL